MQQQSVWFITGASKGIGLLLVRKLLQAGHRVAATSRKLSDLTAAIGPASPAWLPLQTSITDEADVKRAVTSTIEHFGKIDVVVNNAGYGLVGSLEELSDQEVRQSFDVNVFGALHVIRQAMPHLRAQRSGHIFNISSIAGFNGGFPGWGIYCATKFAMDGFTEALAAEAAPFGVHVTSVKPGYFRTEFLSAGSLSTPQSPIADYAEVRATQTAHQEEINGQQAGDPEKAVDLIIRAATEQNPPLHLFLGPDAYQLAEQKMATVQANLQAWEPLATATNFN